MSPYRIDILIFNASKESAADTCANDESLREWVMDTTPRKELGPAFQKRIDVHQ